MKQWMTWMVLLGCTSAWASDYQSLVARFDSEPTADHLQELMAVYFEQDGLDRYLAAIEAIPELLDVSPPDPGSCPDLVSRIEDHRSALLPSLRAHAMAFECHNQLEDEQSLQRSEAHLALLMRVLVENSTVENDLTTYFPVFNTDVEAMVSLLDYQLIDTVYDADVDTPSLVRIAYVMDTDSGVRKALHFDMDPLWTALTDDFIAENGDDVAYYRTTLIGIDSYFLPLMIMASVEDPAAQIGLGMLKIRQSEQFAPLFEQGFAEIVAAASNGSAVAQQLFATVVLHRRDEQQYDRAYEYLIEAVESSFLPAFSTLVSFHEMRLGVEPDSQLTEQLLEAAARFEDQPGQTEMMVALTLASNVEHGTVSALIRYLRLASKKNHSRATMLLAMLHESGAGVEQDHDVAFKLMNEAAESGLDDALFHRGNYYLQGIGVTASVDRAIESWRQALEAGSMDAQLALGMHLIDHGTGPADREEALSLLRIAAEAGENEAAIILAMTLYSQTMAPETAEEVRVLFEQSRSDYPQAHVFLGAMAELGLGQSVDRQQALDHYSASTSNGQHLGYLNELMIDVASYRPLVPTATLMSDLKSRVEQKDPHAQLSLSVLTFFDPEGSKRAAKKLAQSAARQGLAQAEFFLAVMADGNARRRHLEAALEAGYPQAALMLADMKPYPEDLQLYEQMAGVGQARAMWRAGDIIRIHAQSDADYRRACDYYEQASQAGNATGTFQWVECLITGRGREVDHHRAIELLSDLAHRGLSKARWELIKLTREQQSDAISPRDYVEWLGFDARAGRTDSSVQLSRMFLFGHRVPADQELSSLWALNAALGGDQEGLYWMAYNLQLMSSDSQEQLFAEAASLYEQLNELADHEGAQNNLGVMIINEQLPGRPSKDGYRLIKASARENPMARANLAWLLEQGLGVRQNTRKALKEYLEAAEEGAVFAMTRLASAYRDGSLGETDQEKSRYWQDQARNSISKTTFPRQFSSLLADRYPLPPTD